MRLPFFGRNDSRDAEAPATPPTPPGEAEIAAWITAKLARKVGIPPAEVDPARPFAEYGLGSMQAVSLSGDLETWLGRELDPLLLYDHPSIEAIARHLAGAVAADLSVGEPHAGPELA